MRLWGPRGPRHRHYRAIRQAPVAEQARAAQPRPCTLAHAPLAPSHEGAITDRELNPSGGAAAATGLAQRQVGIGAALLGIALLTGLGLRLAPILAADFPLRDGGLFVTHGAGHPPCRLRPSRVQHLQCRQRSVRLPAARPLHPGADPRRSDHHGALAPARLEHARHPGDLPARPRDERRVARRPHDPHLRGHAGDLGDRGRRRDARAGAWCCCSSPSGAWPCSCARRACGTRCWSARWPGRGS